MHSSVLISIYIRLEFETGVRMGIGVCIYLYWHGAVVELDVTREKTPAMQIDRKESSEWNTYFLA
jgi:hypothetical protein